MDSTDRERLSLSREELFSMLAHEVCADLLPIGFSSAGFFASFFLFFSSRSAHIPSTIKSPGSTQDLKRASLLVFANKQDLKGAMTAAEISDQLNLHSIKDHGWHIQVFGFLLSVRGEIFRDSDTMALTDGVVLLVCVLQGCCALTGEG